MSWIVTIQIKESASRQRIDEFPPHEPLVAFSKQHQSLEPQLGSMSKAWSQGVMVIDLGCHLRYIPQKCAMIVMMQAASSGAELSTAVRCALPLTSRLD